jgi:uncharacterized protein YkwD
MRTRAVLAVALLAALLAVTPAQARTSAQRPPTSTAVPATSVATGGILTGDRADLLGWLNGERAARGLSALTVDTRLTWVAQAWTNHMAAAGVLSHNPSTGSQIPSGWLAWGENVAWTQPNSAARIHNAWLASPGHLANMVNPTFTHVGIGWYVDANGRAWATQVFARYASAAPRATFPDVPVGSAFFTEIEWAAVLGITTGAAGGYFLPTAPVTREAVAAFMYRAITGKTIPACTGSVRVFPDVPASHPFCAAIEWLAAQGITTGTWLPNGSFGFDPSAQVTRQAVAAFLYRALNDGTDPACLGATRRFPDVPASQAFCGVIEWLAAERITTGFGDGTFGPLTPVQRQAVVAFLYRSLT